MCCSRMQACNIQKSVRLIRTPHSRVLFNCCDVRLVRNRGGNNPSDADFSSILKERLGCKYAEANPVTSAHYVSYNISAREMTGDW